MDTPIKNQIENLLGVVLCGGKSTRMGSDKGLLMKGNLCWAQIIAEKFTLLNLPYFLSINLEQTEGYAEFFKKDVLIVDDTEANDGPLNGLLSAHQKHPEKDLFIMACDMVDMATETLNKLIHQYQSHTQYDFYAYHNDICWEPLCAIYTAKGLKKLHTNNPSSLQKILSSNNTFKIQIVDLKSFKNYNHLDE